MNLELVRRLLELDLELHHGGGPAGADDGSERHDGGDRLRGLGLAAPEVELLDDAAGPGGRRRGGRVGRGIGAGEGRGGGGGVGQPVAGDDGVVLRARLVVGGDGRRDRARARVLGGVGLHAVGAGQRGGREGRGWNETKQGDEMEGRNCGSVRDHLRRPSAENSVICVVENEKVYVTLNLL